MSLKTEVLDKDGKPLTIGDKVFAGRSGYCYSGYIYRIDSDKVCISSTNPLEERPIYTGYSFFDSSTNQRRHCWTLMKWE